MKKETLRSRQLAEEKYFILMQTENDIIEYKKKLDYQIKFRNKLRKELSIENGDLFH